MFRKRTKTSVPDGIGRAFAVATGLVAEAQRTLLDAIPTSRHPGVPLQEALVTFISALEAAGRAMPAWHDETTRHEWTMCSEGIADARAQAHDLQRRNADLTFEQLNTVIGDVLYPLEVFADAERDLRRR